MKKSIYEYAIIIEPSNNEKYFSFEVVLMWNSYFMDEHRYPNNIFTIFFKFCSFIMNYIKIQEKEYYQKEILIL